MVISSTVIGAYMVEVAQANAGSGRLTSVRQVVQYGSAMAGGPLGGWLASHAFGLTIAASGAVSFLLIPATIFFLHEQKKRVDARELLSAARKQMGKVASARTMWAAAGLMALFYIAPGAQTAVFYRQQDLLHMATKTQGLTQFVQGLAGVVAAIGYGFVCKHINLRNLLFICSRAVRWAA
jgi:hypothetical protein